MILRDYQKEDASVIVQWIRSEEELYRWSADHYHQFPLSGDDINEKYAPALKTGRFFPLTATDEKGTAIGHFIIRYPRNDDDSSVRFGFVILDPGVRGKGYGKEMLRLGTEYVRKNLAASRIELGVFENNKAAEYCYQALGFKEYARKECSLPPGIWSCIEMELFLQKTPES